MKDNLKPIITGIAVSICSAALGFGVSQATLATKVEVVVDKVNRHERILQDMKEESEKHMAAVIDLFKEDHKTTQALINIVSVQNELLQRKVTHNP